MCSKRGCQTDEMIITPRRPRLFTRYLKPFNYLLYIRIICTARSYVSKFADVLSLRIKTETKQRKNQKLRLVLQRDYSDQT